MVGSINEQEKPVHEIGFLKQLLQPIIEIFKYFFLTTQGRNLLIVAISFSFVFLFHFVKFSTKYPTASTVFGVTICMGLLWAFQPIPLAITSLVPVFIFPFFGITNGNVVSSAYINNISMIFTGGFAVALAMERWHLHKRIALQVLLTTGNSLGKLTFGFMMTSFVLSMWISNTATALIMIPNAIAVIQRLDDISKEKFEPFTIGLFLGIAHSCNIGGISTTIGTPPNLIFLEQFKKFFPNRNPPTFFQWLLFGIPLSLTFEFILFGLIYLFYVLRTQKRLQGNESSIDLNVFKQELNQMGPMLFEEYCVLISFLTLILLWCTRSGIGILPGWDSFFKKNFITDGSVAILVAFFLFIIPAKNKPPGEREEKKRCVMDWESMYDFPWDIILLFGGGFALADGFIDSGLTQLVAENLISLKSVPVFLLTLIVAGVVCAVTDVASNIATSQIFLPIMAALSISIQINPLLLMIVTTISSSFSFLLPVSTAPNMVVFSTKRLTVLDMMKLGFVLDVIGTIFVTLFCYFLLPFILGFKIY